MEKRTRHAISLLFAEILKKTTIIFFFFGFYSNVPHLGHLGGPPVENRCLGEVILFFLSRTTTLTGSRRSLRYRYRDGGKGDGGSRHANSDIIELRASLWQKSISPLNAGPCAARDPDGNRGFEK